MHRRLSSWVIASTGLGLLLAVIGWRLRAGSGAPDEREELRFMIAAGVGLLVAAAAAVLARRPLGALLGDQEPEASGAPAHPLFTLLLASFVCLFLEVMLIRYVGSQVRIFSFYKNIPLISCYLGMGIGCFLRRGRARDVFLFLLWLLPIALVLSCGSFAISRSLGRWAAAASSEQILGDVVLHNVTPHAALAGQVLMGAFAVVALVAITLLFVPLGRLLGEALQPMPRLAGYTVNIIGSLLGVAAFVAASYAWLPPWSWFLIGLLPLLWWLKTAPARITALLLIAANALAVAPSTGETIWSPYQKLIGRERIDAANKQKSYLVEISDVFYQVAVDLRPEAVAAAGRNAYPHYDAQFADLPRGARVLIVGAGTGNDVAAALRAGALVDAVDIDPAIVQMGRSHHPEHPYADPRTTVIINDARAAFREARAGTYDAVVFGLLDSHTQLGISSIRLDNYVFTLESFADARRLLAPNGRLVVTAATFRNWFARRLADMLSVTCGSRVSSHRAGAWITYSCTPAATPAAEDELLRQSETLPTDDWPFLYLPDATVPAAYLIVIGMLALAAVLLLRAQGLAVGRLEPWQWHLFFLGAAFLLVEVHAINRLALLFGSTWLVSAVTIALVLLLILCANLIAAQWPDLPYPFAYLGLFAALAASYFVNDGLPAPAVAVLQVLPVLFAGLIFARSYRGTVDAGPAIGANMLGAVLGGWMEYASMAIGIRALLLLAAAVYFGSALALVRAQRQPAVH